MYGFSAGEERAPRDTKRPSHIFPHKTHQKPSTKKKEEPIDGRCFHTQMAFVPVQIVDADKFRQDRRDKGGRTREERLRIERREDVTTLRQTWEATDYSRRFEYNSGQRRDRHMYDHRFSSRVYQANPRESSPQPPAHIPNKFLVRKEECVSRVKKYEYQSKKEKVGCDTRPAPKEHLWGRGSIRTRD